MKQPRTIEVSICDFCGSDHAYSHCRRCGKDACYKCEEVHGIGFKHSVWASGSGDGFYCHQCLTQIQPGTDELLLAYRTIHSLKMEAKGWNEDFTKRAKTAEERLKELLRSSG